MRFRPFGSRIDLISPYSWEECRSRISSRLVPAGKRPFVDRPRGVFIGRLLIIWMRWGDFVDRESRPKLICWFSHYADQTRVVGLAVPGFTAILFLPFWTILCAIGAMRIGLFDPGYVPQSPATYLIVKGLIAALIIGFGAALWLRLHYLGREARPMIRFLSRAIDADCAD